jgi:hypothetical protein
MRELSRRVNNEFTSAINVISLTAARSRNSEVKSSLNDVCEGLRHYADVHRPFKCPRIRRVSTHQHIFGSYVSCC